MAEPTLELGLRQYLSTLTYAIVRPEVNLQQLVDAHGSVVCVRQAGGTEQRWQTIARITIETYAKTYTRAWQDADAVSALLLDSPYRAGGWLIDRCASESANAEQAHPNLRVVAAVLRVTTRHRVSA